MCICPCDREDGWYYHKQEKRKGQAKEKDLEKDDFIERVEKTGEDVSKYVACCRVSSFVLNSVTMREEKINYSSLATFHHFSKKGIYSYLTQLVSSHLFLALHVFSFFFYGPHSSLSFFADFLSLSFSASSMTSVQKPTNGMT